MEIRDHCDFRDPASRYQCIAHAKNGKSAAGNAAESVKSAVANGLLQALGKIPSEMRVYKSQLPIREGLVAYLKRICG